MTIKILKETITLVQTEMDLTNIPIYAWPKEAIELARSALSVNYIYNKFINLPKAEQKAYLIEKMEQVQQFHTETL